MRESSSCDHAFPLGLFERAQHALPIAVRCRDQIDGRAGERGDLEQDVDGLGRKPGEPLAEQLAQAFGNRQRRGPARAACSCGRARARAPVRRTGSRPSSRRTRASSGRVSSRPSRSLSRLWVAARVSGPTRSSLEAFLPVCARELERSRDLGAGPKGRKEAHRLLAQAADRKLQDQRRGRVEPLDVVERHDHRPFGGQSAEHVEHCEPDRARLRRLLARLREPERDLERPASRGRSERTTPSMDGLEQIGEPGEGERRLGLDRCDGRARGRIGSRPARRLSPRESSCRSPARRRGRARVGPARPRPGTRRLRRAPRSRPMTGDHHQASTLSRVPASSARRTPSLR